MLTFAIVLAITCRATGYRATDMLRDLLPFGAAALLMTAAEIASMLTFSNPFLQLAVMIAVGAAVYVGVMRIARVPELPEASAYVFGRFRRFRKKT